MRAIIGRLRRLVGLASSGQAGPEYLRIVVSRLDRKRSLVNAKYTSCSSWAGGGIEVIRLDRAPVDSASVTDEEFEQWIQEQRAAKEASPIQ